MRHLIFILSLIFVSAYSASAQTQSWQWVKAGGSTSDNIGDLPANCIISGCDAKGNVYAEGAINGPNMVFDTFQSAGTLNPSYLDPLIFSYDCSGNMRWAKQIGNTSGTYTVELPGMVTDIQGNTYFSSVLLRGFIVGDTTIDAGTPNNYFIYMIKLDSLGKIVWVKKYDDDYSASSTYANGISAGMRIGSSGNIWMRCYLDSNFNFAPALHAVKQGYYQVEIDPTNGNILGGYYTSSSTFGDDNNLSGNYDLDEHENYYETGVLYGGLGIYDTLILNQSRYWLVDTAGPTYANPFVYSLDKQGNFRFILRDTLRRTEFSNLKGCRYDEQMHRLLIAMNLDGLVAYGGDTFNCHCSQTSGVLAIDTDGNVIWGKYVTSTSADYNLFHNPLTPQYFVSRPATGYYVYDNSADTVQNGIGYCTSNCTDFYFSIAQIDTAGNFKASYNAYLGVINTNVAGDIAESGATDWRGNLYMGGSITNYMALPNGGDSVVNTDATSGNFFIAKIGISDCSCPTPGVQFTQASHGDTVTFYGSSINHSDSIHWELGDGTLSTTDTFTHVYADTGTYTVTAIAYSGCGIDSITRQVRLTPTGINTIQSLQTRAYPNPAQGTIYVDVSGAAKIGMVAANGSSMWDAPKEVNQSGTYVFDMGKYSAGLYYFLVEYSNGEVNVLQVVKE